MLVWRCKSLAGRGTVLRKPTSRFAQCSGRARDLGKEIADSRHRQTGRVAESGAVLHAPNRTTVGAIRPTSLARAWQNLSYACDCLSTGVGPDGA